MAPAGPGSRGRDGPAGAGRTMRWPTRLSQKLILSLTVVVTLVVVANGIFAVRSAETQLQATMLQGADQLSGTIASATWHAMLADHRESAYQVMQTIAAKQGIDRQDLQQGRARHVLDAPRPDEGRRQEGRGLLPLPRLRAAARAGRHADARPRRPQARRPRTLAMITPIYNEPACSNAACHAHPADAERPRRPRRRPRPAASSTSRSGASRCGRRSSPRSRSSSSGSAPPSSRGGSSTKPLARLADATRHVAEMHLDRPIALGSSEELAELARSFNEMRVRLADAMDEINGFTRSLEEKVEERTEQLKVAQQKLMQTDRLASLGQLSASVAHEINNPLSGVLNLSMLMQRILKDDGIPKGRVAEFRRYLGQVATETARRGASSPTSSPSRGGPSPHRAEADLNAIIGTTLSLVAHKLKLMNVEVELRPRRRAPAPPRRRVADPAGRHEPRPERRRGDAGQGGGHLRVATRASADTKDVAPRVKDNGEG